MVVVNAACPFVSDTGLPTFTPLSWNCTVPVGVEAPVDASKTLAANVMFPLGVTLEAEAVAVVAEAEPADGSTWISPIMPASSCCRMWQ